MTRENVLLPNESGSLLSAILNTHGNFGHVHVLTGATGTVGAFHTASYSNLHDQEIPQPAIVLLLGVRSSSPENARERITQLLNHMEVPFRQDLLYIVFPGDLTKVGLGISPQDTHIMQHIFAHALQGVPYGSIQIFHHGASVEFNSPATMTTNLEGTKNILEYIREAGKERLKDMVFNYTGSAYIHSGFGNTYLDSKNRTDTYVSSFSERHGIKTRKNNIGIVGIGTYGQMPPNFTYNVFMKIPQTAAVAKDIIHTAASLRNIAVPSPFDLSQTYLPHFSDPTVTIPESSTEPHKFFTELIKHNSISRNSQPFIIVGNPETHLEYTPGDMIAYLLRRIACTAHTINDKNNSAEKSTYILNTHSFSLRELKDSCCKIMGIEPASITFISDYPLSKWEEALSQNIPSILVASRSMLYIPYAFPHNHHRRLSELARTSMIYALGIDPDDYLPAPDTCLAEGMTSLEYQLWGAHRALWGRDNPHSGYHDIQNNILRDIYKIFKFKEVDKRKKNLQRKAAIILKAIEAVKTLNEDSGS